MQRNRHARSTQAVNPSLYPIGQFTIVAFAIYNIQYKKSSAFGYAYNMNTILPTLRIRIVSYMTRIFTQVFRVSITCMTKYIVCCFILKPAVPDPTPTPSPAVIVEQ